VGDGPRVLAVAESDSYTKWAAWSATALYGTDDVELVVLRSPTMPSPGQVVAACRGTIFESRPIAVETIGKLRRRVQSLPPRHLLLACTGPTIAVITMLALPRRNRPVVTSGLPGVGVPVRAKALLARSRTDVFVAHSHRERREYAAGFREIGAPTIVGLSSLPFLGHGDHVARDGTASQIVFAPQPSVPPTREDRESLLLKLARLGPPAPVVKLRNTAAERVTHAERYPYRVLWDDLVDEGRVARGSDLSFVEGPIAAVLPSARVLVTVSSTAALEAVAASVPVLILDDWGVSDELLNDVFVGSGVLGSLDRDAVDAAPLPHAGWRHDNYFHDPAENDAPGLLATAQPSVPSSRIPPVRVWTTIARRSARLLHFSLTGAGRAPHRRVSEDE
jgi:hypothetical protein